MYRKTAAINRNPFIHPFIQPLLTLAWICAREGENDDRIWRRDEIKSVRAKSSTMKEKIRRRRKKYFHETVNALIILLLLCHVQVSKSQRTTYNGDDNGEDDLRRKSGFLYVPPGKGVDEGIILHEITQDQLPPGEYEIVAKFQDPSEAVESPFQTAASRFVSSYTLLFIFVDIFLISYAEK